MKILGGIIPILLILIVGIPLMRYVFEALNWIIEFWSMVLGVK